MHGPLIAAVLVLSLAPAARAREATEESFRPGAGHRGVARTKAADEILASVARFCQRISNSGH